MTRNADDIARDLRNLPAVDRVMASLAPDTPPRLAAGAARSAIDDARARIRNGETISPEDIIASARAVVDAQMQTRLRTVINATGVLIHTNLGRAPLGAEQLEAVTRVAAGYSNLEYELGTGDRGNRYVHAAGLISALSGADAAIVTNNNAAAVLVSLSALAREREVIVSRGELVEIGGSFRIPDVMERSGATLVEVGTTNRTRLEDFEKAITENTAAILKVHPSNYRIVGFSDSVPSAELGRMARGRGVTFIHDLGSGLIDDAPGIPSSDEPRVRKSLDEGADLVTFSGDKLLGGPQCGVIAGREDLISRIARDPLMRVVRPDKMTLAALEATLVMYLEGRAGDLPLWKMYSASLDELEARARKIAAATSGDATIEAAEVRAIAGGGSLPGEEIPSWAVAARPRSKSPAEVERNLRRHDPPIIVRVEKDRVLADLRTVPPEMDDTLAATLSIALA